MAKLERRDLRRQFVGRRTTLIAMSCVLFASACTGSATDADEPSDTTETTQVQPSDEVLDERDGEVHVHEDGSSHTHGAGAPKEWTVTYTADGTFDPERVDILAGDTVTFVNASEWGVWPASNIHPTHEILPEFDPLGEIPPGESWSHTFTENGYWRYHNHSEASEVGLIVVSGAPEGSLSEAMRAFEDLSLPEPPADASGSVLLADEAELERFVRRHGSGAAARLMWEHVGVRQVDCHNAAHVAGRVAYEQFGPAAFVDATHDCRSGALHGALEAMFAERGTSRIHEDIKSLCLASGNAWHEWNCWHGVGHGLMAWVSYEIGDALGVCDLLEESRGRFPCYSGVFMENIVGGMSRLTGHETEFLNDDPHFPCNVLEDRYVPTCYGYQQAQMLRLFNGDFRAVVRECGSLDENLRLICVRSIGHGLGVSHRGYPASSIQVCGLVPDEVGFAVCVGGVVAEMFWQPEEADSAAAFCRLVDDRAASNECWWQMLDRGQHLFEDRSSREGFCARFPAGQRQQYCREQLLPQNPST